MSAAATTALRVLLVAVLAFGNLSGAWWGAVRAYAFDNAAQGASPIPVELSVQAKDDGGGKSGVDDGLVEKNQEALDELEELIDQLGKPANVKPSQEKAVQEALEARDDLKEEHYDEFTDDQKDFFDELSDRLDEISDALDKQLEDKEAADAVIELIASLPDPSEVGVDDRGAADEASEAYEVLSSDQKKHVPQADSDKLRDVLDAVEAAEKAAEKADEEKRKQEEEREKESDSSSSSASDGSRSSESSSASGKAKDTYYVSVLLMKWDEPDEFGERHFVGDGSIVEDSYQSLGIDEFGKTVQLTGWYASTDGTGIIYQTADSSTDIGSFDLTWKSSDEKVATVSPAGLVTPRGKNGTVKITATVADKSVYKDKAPSTSVTIRFSGQEGRYVKQVDILDEDGEVIGERWGGVSVYNEENSFHQLQARVTWCDAASGAETVVETGEGDSYNEKNVETTVIWGVSTSSAFTINEDTGRLRTGAYSGNAYVTCTVVGGLGGADVADTANVQLDTGVYEYNPAQSLELRVVYEERPDEVVKEASYTYEELLGMLGTRHVNATVVSDSRFGVISADGFLFKDVVDLVAVDDADVLQYRFTTADGYDNPVSYQYLFESGPRYYFPNYDLGGSQADGEIVSPMLAYRSAMEWNRSQANPSAELDDGNRFRLVFGCLASGDANTSFQIYYINAITVVLKGAPSAGGGDGSGEGGNGGNGGSGTAPDGPSTPGVPSGPAPVNPGGQSGKDALGGTTSPSGPPDSGQPQDSSGSSSAHANQTQSGDGRESQDEPAGAHSAGDASRSGSASADNQQPAQSDPGNAGDVMASGANVDPSKRWRVFQMMNKTNSDVPDWDDENPISPFAAPIAIGTFFVGAGATGIGFRRRLR